MLKLRRKLGEYQELFYMIFVLSMTGMTSMGLNSEDEVYMQVFVVATCFLLLKMAVTNFTIKELLIMAVITFVLGRNFLYNGEKTLILTVMGIFGAKNVDLQRVMRWAFWEKAVLTAGTIGAAACGFVENEIIRMKKAGEFVEIYCYGYYHPNMAFANIFVVLLLAIIVYGGRWKWFMYMVGTITMLVAYEIFMCRTGMIIWCVLCVMVLGYRLFKWIKFEKGYAVLMGFLPAAMATLIVLFAKWARESEEFNQLINSLLNNRIRHINRFWNGEMSIVQGSATVEPFDSIYFHLLYNYGWLVFGIFILLYCAAIWYCGWKGHGYVAIALGIMSIYGFMEMLPLSFLWNMPLLYVAWLLFGEPKSTIKAGRSLKEYIAQYRAIHN